MREPATRAPATVEVRRRVVVVTTGAFGAGVLAWGLRTDPGSGAFYAGTLALAAVWTVGGFLSGPIHLGWSSNTDPPRRPLVGPVLVGVLLGAVFVAGALLVRHIEALASRVEGVLAYARGGAWLAVLGLTVANGVAEEIFFRGAVQHALPPRLQLPGSVMVYALVTLATGNVMLAGASLVLGGIAGVQQRATGGVLAPALTHVTWSVLMLVFLPLVFR